MSAAVALLRDTWHARLTPEIEIDDYDYFMVRIGFRNTAINWTKCALAGLAAWKFAKWSQPPAWALTALATVGAGAYLSEVVGEYDGLGSMAKRLGLAPFIMTPCLIWAVIGTRQAWAQISWSRLGSALLIGPAIVSASFFGFLIALYPIKRSAPEGVAAHKRIPFSVDACLFAWKDLAKERTPHKVMNAASYLVKALLPGYLFWKLMAGVYKRFPTLIHQTNPFYSPISFSQLLSSCSPQLGLIALSAYGSYKTSSTAPIAGLCMSFGLMGIRWGAVERLKPFSVPGQVQRLVIGASICSAAFVVGAGGLLAFNPRFRRWCNR